MRRVARVAEEAFGGFDTWINNAGVSVYGKLEDVPVEDMRHLFETNFWGLVYGSLAAVEHLKQRGGALINLGSTVSDRAAPLQGIYSASKHAIKGFTDALRMELEDDGAPISVTLIKPGPIDTPYPLNAKNYLDAEPQHVPPVYAPDPDTVARAILHAAETPTRDVFVGAGGKMNALLGYFAPRLADRYMETTMISGTKSDRPVRPREQNALDHPSEHLAERGDYPGHVSKTGLYTQATLHPVVAGAALLVAGLAIAELLRESRDGDDAWPTTRSDLSRNRRSLRGSDWER